jgi:hypothetical protein
MVPRDDENSRLVSKPNRPENVKFADEFAETLAATFEKVPALTSGLRATAIVVNGGSRAHEAAKGRGSPT